MDREPILTTHISGGDDVSLLATGRDTYAARVDAPMAAFTLSIEPPPEDAVSVRVDTRMLTGLRGDPYDRKRVWHSSLGAGQSLLSLTFRSERGHRVKACPVPVAMHAYAAQEWLTIERQFGAEREVVLHTLHRPITGVFARSPGLVELHLQYREPVAVHGCTATFLVEALQRIPDGELRSMRLSGEGDPAPY